MTINLEDDIVPVLKQYAKDRSISLAQAVSALLRRGLRATPPMRVVNGIYVVDLPEDSPRVTAEHVRAEPETDGPSGVSSFQANSASQGRFIRANPR